MFYPIGLETFGGMGKGAKDFLDDLKERLATTTGHPRSGHYFYQRLALTMVRHNVACVMGTMISRDGFRFLPEGSQGA